MAETKTHRAHCPTCEIQTEERHTEMSARRLCELHNETRDDCNAEPVPVCWVCHGRATHQNQKPPYEYVCDEHALSIDAVPIDQEADP